MLLCDMIPPEASPVRGWLQELECSITEKICPLTRPRRLLTPWMCRRQICIWDSDDESLRQLITTFLTPDATKMQYEAGSSDKDAIAPESHTLDQALLDRPGNGEIQLALFKDYKSNVELYPAFHEYFRESKVPLLVVWGANDAIFSKNGALAYLEDLPLAEVHLLDAGHFAVETETEKIATLIVSFLENKGIWRHKVEA